MSFVTWAKTFFSAPDGQGSSKRLKSFIFCLLVCWMVGRGLVTTKVQLYCMYALLVTILLLDAVITVQDIVNLKNGNQPAAHPPDAIKEGDKIEVTKVD